MDQQRKRELPPEVAAALSELKAVLADIYGERLRGVYLYGSYARGDFDPESSDIDVLVVLAGEVEPAEEIRRTSAAVSDICLRHDVLLAELPVSEAWLRERKTPLFENVRREAVPI
ncbi:MAG TPA: nucleotidyltransferase domain-containing protein [Chloroflexota bacterium]|nr:nucleotidyltransferase domain-containing protein [Chloroflexota bacterium]